MNYIDLIILVVVALFAYMGYLRGFIRDFADLVALAAALALAYFTSPKSGMFFEKTFALSGSLTNIVAFFFTWFAVMFAYYALMTFFYDRVPESIRKSRYNKWFGLLPATIRSVTFIWFTVNLLYLLMASGTLKQDLNSSYFAQNLIKSNATVSRLVNDVFGSAAAKAVDFLTVKPQSSESITLGFTTTDVTTNSAMAKEMLDMINVERKSRDLNELVFDEVLAKVGEAHGEDMFARGYFSHNTPDGKTPFDRMDAAGILYLMAGENLALAPTLDEAFAGLMASPGHRANMLSSDFGKVGIGVVDGGVYGLMFAQEFTN